MDLKTLHLTNAYQACSGESRTMYHALMEQAARECRQIRLVVPAEDDGEEWVSEHALIYRVRAPRAPAFDRRYRCLLPHRLLRAGRGRLWQIIHRERPDVVEVCDKYSLCYLAGLLRRRRASPSDGPTLIGLTCERMDDNLAAHLPGLPAAGAVARAFLGRVYIGMFDAHLANSNYTAEELRTAMVAPHLRPVYVTPMGVEVPLPPTRERRRAIRQAVRERLGVRLDAGLVVYAGRLSREKYVGALVTIAARLAWRNTYLVIAGDGPLRRTLAADCARHAPAAARFVGHVGRQELQDLLTAADVFVHPNPREPFGIAPLEAMAAGLPVVLPRAGGVLTYATDENAWLVRADADELADGVEAALWQPDGSAARARAARATAESFAWPAAASAMLNAYDAIHRARLDPRQALARNAGFASAAGPLFGADD